MPSKVLLTGATGFLGTYITEALRHEPALPYVPVHRGQLSTGVRWDLAQGLKDLDGIDFDVVCHAAAAIPAPGNTDYAMNVRMTEHLLASLGRRPAAFVLVSTLDVYAPPSGILVEDSPLGPVTPYAESKLRCEELVRSHAADTGTPLVILRMTHLYGPREPPLKFIPKAIDAVTRGTPIQVHGDGSDLRDYLYAEDAARAVVAMLRNPVEGTFNVASGSSVAIRDVAEEIIAIAGKGTIKYLPRQKPRVDYRFDIGALKAACGFTPAVPLEEGLRRHIQWRREQQGARL